MRLQRLRVAFSKGTQLRYITHLDLMRFWERALRRANVAIAYSEGFSPHPQISLASPLPVGVTAVADLMDVFLSRVTPPLEFMRLLSPQLPPGLSLTKVEEIDLSLPSIQSQMRAAEFRVELPIETDLSALGCRIKTVLSLRTLPWQHTREHEVRNYDLRPLIQDLRLTEASESSGVVMRLQSDITATGRPEQVLACLGLAPSLPIERTRLILAEDVADIGDGTPDIGLSTARIRDDRA
jgi:radical SAM-linked protein